MNSVFKCDGGIIILAAVVMAFKMLELVEIHGLAEIVFLICTQYFFKF